MFFFASVSSMCTLYARRLAQVNSVISACDRRAVEDTSTVLRAFRKPIGNWFIFGSSLVHLSTAARSANWQGAIALLDWQAPALEG